MLLLNVLWLLPCKMLMYSKYEIHTARISPLGAGVVSGVEELEEEPDELDCELLDEDKLLETGLELELGFCELDAAWLLFAEEGFWLTEALFVLLVPEVLLCVEFSPPLRLELNGGSSGM